MDTALVQRVGEEGSENLTPIPASRLTTSVDPGDFNKFFLKVTQNAESFLRIGYTPQYP
jgi:hypothetical protein